MTRAAPIHIHGARGVADESPVGLVIAAGAIADIGPQLAAAGTGPEFARTIDARGLTLAPGLVDLRVFVGEPGAEHRETLRSAGAAAVAGGVTTLVTRPDTNPPVDDPAIVDFIRLRAAGACAARVAPSAAITRGLMGREMAEIGLLAEAGAVFFSEGPRSVRDAGVLRRAMTYARAFGALIVHHCEDADLVGEGVMNEGELSSRLGLHGVPAEAETVILDRDLRLSRLTGARYHAALVSCRASVDAIRRAKEEGLAVTCGVSINHLTLNEGDVGDYRTFLRLSPPLRGEEERLALVEALAEGVIDVIVSDHDPQDVEVKRRPFADAEPGAIGLETMLPAAWRLAHAGLVTPARLIEALSATPARLIGSPTGVLSKGAPADLILFDPDEPFVVDAASLRSLCKNTPFDAARLQGRVRLTVVGGEVVFDGVQDG